MGEASLTKLLAETDMKPVESSNLQSIGYNEKEKVLFVEFKTGSKYAYTNVNKEVYQELMSAESHGKYFHKNIRNSYAYTKV